LNPAWVALKPHRIQKRWAAARSLLDVNWARKQPELFMGEPFDGAVDVFALGVTFWFLLVGRRPFAGAGLPQIMRAIVETSPPAPSSQRERVPPLVDELVMSMLARRAADRPSAEAVDDALATIAVDVATVARLVAS